MARSNKRLRGPHLVALRTPAGASWWYAYLPGRQRIALGTQDAAQAEHLFAELLARKPVAERGAHGPETTLAQLAAEYLTAPHGWTPRTRRSAAHRVRLFVEAMLSRGVDRPSRVTDAALDAWRSERERVVSRATINRDEAVARRFLGWSSERGLSPETPLSRRKLLREPRRPRGKTLPSPATVARIVGKLEDLEEHGAALTVAVLSATGLRLDEVRHLRAGWIEGGAVHLRPEGGAASEAWTSKGYKARRVPLAPEALEAVRAFARWRTSARGGMGKALGLSDGWLYERLDRATQALGLPPVRPHDLRRVWVTEAVRSGLPVSTVRDLVGHRDVTTTEGYVGRYAEDVVVAPPVPAAVAALRRPPAPGISTVATPLPLAPRKRGSKAGNERQ